MIRSNTIQYDPIRSRVGRHKVLGLAVSLYGGGGGERSRGRRARGEGGGRGEGGRGKREGARDRGKRTGGRGEGRLGRQLFLFLFLFLILFTLSLSEGTYLENHYDTTRVTITGQYRTEG